MPEEYIVPQPGDLLKKVYQSKLELEEDMKVQEAAGIISLSYVKNQDGTFSVLYYKTYN